MKRRTLTRVSLAALAVTAALSANAPSASSAPPASWVRADYMGDSYTAGTNVGGEGRHGYPYLVGHQLHWGWTNHAISGTGFVYPGKADARRRGVFATQIKGVVHDHPKVVVVMGSRNDMGHATGQQEQVAAAHVFTQLHLLLPDAEIIAVGPPWVDGNPPAALLTIRDAVARAAHDTRTPFIDPVAEGWFSGAASRLIVPHNIHPGNAGHAYMARLLVADIRRRGLALR